MSGSEEILMSQRLRTRRAALPATVCSVCRVIRLLQIERAGQCSNHLDCADFSEFFTAEKAEARRSSPCHVSRRFYTKHF